MKYPSYCCQKCGEMIGWLGRIMPLHKCKEKNTEWIDLTGEELETLLRENRSLTLGSIWAVADKLKEKNNG